MPNRIVVHFLQTYGHLHVLREVRRKGPQMIRHFECICDCHNITEVSFGHLCSGHTISCGCMGSRNTVAQRSTIHGESESGEYQIWLGLPRRCYDKTRKSYKHYGGRGITVCPEWRHDYPAFLAHVGRRPGPEYSIERINNNLGYEPGNVKWGTPIEQGRNKRNNIWVQYKGERRLVIDVCVEVGLKYKTLLYRYHNGFREGELFQPVPYRRGL